MPLFMNIDMGYNFVNIVNTITILFMVMGDVAGCERAGGAATAGEADYGDVAGCGRAGVLGGGGLTGGRGGFMLRGLDSRWRGMAGGGGGWI